MFGLDLKSVVVGMLLAWFVIPWVQSLISNMRAPKTTG